MFSPQDKLQINLYFIIFKIISQLDVSIQGNSRFKVNLGRGVHLFVISHQWSVFIRGWDFEIPPIGELNASTIFLLSIYRLYDTIL